mmetsp:Transcript_13888/g.34847  ORF Transcript_13888/g.34847 Transcript_13888/m.34847 type:complete len:206 (+) Transcript_13888:407-1024(+)
MTCANSWPSLTKSFLVLAGKSSKPVPHWYSMMLRMGVTIHFTVDGTRQSRLMTGGSTPKPPTVPPMYSTSPLLPTWHHFSSSSSKNSSGLFEPSNSVYQDCQPFARLRDGASKAICVQALCCTGQAAASPTGPPARCCSKLVVASSRSRSLQPGHRQSPGVSRGIAAEVQLARGAAANKSPSMWAEGAMLKAVFQGGPGRSTSGR